MIYLDSAATTKPKAEVIREINNFFTDKWYNPSSLYSPACDVKNEMDRARKIIAKSINAKPNEIYFTSGGSESNNFAIQGFHKKYPNAPIITTSLEHKSIIKCAESISDNVYIISPSRDGIIMPDSLERTLKYYNNECTKLVSIQFANNEVGTIQDIKALSKIAHKYNAYFHTDAVQAYPHMNINVSDFGIDLMSVSGHKIGCPKGIGFLYIKDSVCIEPLIYGSQENNMRGGTENVPYIMGLAKAIEIKNNKSLIYYRDYFENKLQELGCIINCNTQQRLDNIISCILPNKIVSELFMYMLGFDEIYSSTGSACNSKSNSPSYVLKSIGLSNEAIQSTIRFSMSEDITTKDIDIVLEKIKSIIVNLNK